MAENPKIWVVAGGGGLLAIVIVLGLVTGGAPPEARGAGQADAGGAPGPAPGPQIAPIQASPVGFVPFGAAQTVTFPLPRPVDAPAPWMSPGAELPPPFMAADPAVMAMMALSPGAFSDPGLVPQIPWDPNQIYWPPPLPPPPLPQGQPAPDAGPTWVPGGPTLPTDGPINVDPNGPVAPAASGAPSFQQMPFQEAHWQGIEVIPLTPSLAKLMKIPAGATGVLADDVTFPADVQGFQAGDLINAVGQIPTPSLDAFMAAADRVRDRRRTEISFLRNGRTQSLVLVALQERLGNANGEAAPMIQAGSRPPHGYKGACTNCHNIGKTGQLAVDQGDQIVKRAPPISAGQTPPHRNRGACAACHQIFP